jgi:2-keto-3-deoxy-L-rhamnonate aldolase RhmA
MRKSKILAKIRSGQAAKISSLGHYLPFFVRYAAHYGYDGIWLDLEHRAMDDREVQSLLAFCHLFDIDCMLRPPSIERSRLYRYLEDGATGFMIPFLSDQETAQKVVEAAKFPPLGNRGADGAGLDGDYGLQAWDENNHYTRDANQETFIVGQIETPEAVTKADEVAAVPGIDALFVGTGDLGLRLAETPHPDVKNLDSALEQVSGAARRHGKAWGAATSSLDNLRRYRRMGAQVLTWGNDFGLRQVLANCSADLESVLREELPFPQT